MSEKVEKFLFKSLGARCREFESPISDQNPSEINDFRGGEWVASNTQRLAPKEVQNTFSGHLYRFLAIFDLFHLLFDALNSAVSGCSSAVCGNLCGQKRFPPGFR